MPWHLIWDNAWRKWISFSVLTIQIGDCSQTEKTASMLSCQWRLTFSITLTSYVSTMHTLRGFLAHLHLTDYKMLFALEAFRFRKWKFSGPMCQYLKKKKNCAKQRNLDFNKQWAAVAVNVHRTPFKVPVPPAIFSPSSVNLGCQFKMTANLFLGFIIHSFVLSVNIC